MILPVFVLIFTKFAPILSAPDSTNSSNATQALNSIEKISTTMPPPLPPSCDPSRVTYMIAHFIDGNGELISPMDKTHELITLLANGSGLNIDDKSHKNTRFRLGLMQGDYVGYGPNVTVVNDIDGAFSDLESQISYDHYIDYFRSLRTFANNSEFSDYDMDTESPPIAILYPGIDNVYGQFNIKSGFDALTAKGYKTIAINMDKVRAGDLTTDLKVVLGDENVYERKLNENLDGSLNFIMNKLCALKSSYNGVQNFGLLSYLIVLCVCYPLGLNELY